MDHGSGMEGFDTRFADLPEPGRQALVWAGKETPEIADTAAHVGASLSRVEDGFLRSAGPQNPYLALV